MSAVQEAHQNVEETNKGLSKGARISFKEFADVDFVECTSRMRSQGKKKRLAIDCRSER